MAAAEQVTSKTNGLVVTPQDILFECPSCGKSLVVDEAGEGMIIDCPKCHINVIVPPKAQTAAPLPIAPVKAAAAAVPVTEAADTGDLRSQLAALTNKLKELQTQRTELNNRMASRINDINRDIVMTARLETAHQQIIAELTHLVGQISESGPGPAGRTRVNLRS
jgi:hypothetical protein